MAAFRKPRYVFDPIAFIDREKREDAGTPPSINLNHSDTGLRNGEGFAFDSGGRIYATQHGRDQLSQNFPSLHQPEQGADLPAEELLLLEHDADFGWPECYYDDKQQKLVLAPEYGGVSCLPNVSGSSRSNPMTRAFWAPRCTTP